MRRRDVLQAIAAERVDLGRVLRALDAGAWDTPTLVPGWTVRDVAAHLTSLGRYYRVVSPALIVAARYRRRVPDHFDALAHRAAAECNRRVSR